MKNIKQKFMQIVLVSGSLYLAGCGMNENARNLNLDGLVSFVCNGKAPDGGQPNICGNKSVWVEADNGRIAYVTVYGITNIEEAHSIANYIQNLKARNKQNIPVQISIFSCPRLAGREPSNFNIYKDNL